MPQKNIYVREEDEQVFQKAEKLFEGKSLSKTVVEALREYVDKKESGKEMSYGKFTREVIPVGKMPREDTPDRWIKFTGRLLVSHTESGESKAPETKSIRYMIYQGKQGELLLIRKLLFPTPDDVEENSKTEYVVDKTFDGLRVKSDYEDWKVPETLWGKVKDELNNQIIELPLADLKLGR